VANLTFKAFLASPPTVRNTRNLRILTESVKSFITLVTIKQLVFLFSTAANLTILAVLALPVLLECVFFIFRNLYTVRMEALSTEITGKEFLIVSKGST